LDSLGPQLNVKHGFVIPPPFCGTLKGQNQCLEIFMRGDEGEWMEKGITLISGW